ncbi:peptidoglycan DD-metalloendopeptidase family protein [Halalkalibacter alkaliphilus]|uniref:M23 family metallopeptidase n=1 Tax=Halalkalibacter alkaliphilus TaxID=2917993 RepID=A0A9X2CSK2_9BACI|nr:M23 family metallopeptidase [Halalkalibacter alkaliphilus]MCL7747493.1 M23 family metallopeptidase [Halalkalibacter alkaliphilus]
MLVQENQSEQEQLQFQIPRKKYLQTCLAFLLAIMVSFAFTSQIKADERSVHTIYHVYVDDQHLGIIENDDPIYEYINELEEKHEEKFPELSLAVGENVRVIPEFVFNKEDEDEEVLTKLEDESIVQAEAIALVINEKPIVYVASLEEVEELLQLLITQYVDEEKYEQFLDAEKEDGQLDVGEKQITSVTLTEEITEEEVLVFPEEVVSVKDAIKKFNKGVLEEQPYTVKEGDVLGTIASDHNLTTSELLELNSELDRDSVIRVGDEIKVQAYKPVVKVLSTYVTKKEEEIPFETEVREDDSMFKGDQKVTQEGQAGVQVIEYEVTEENGSLTKRSVLSEEVTKEPVKKVVTKGTKVIPSRGSGTLGWPAVGGYISSYQGNRWGRFHRGIDIARPSNYNILASDNGTVTFAGTQGGYGNLVRINHNNGMETLYAHLASIDVSVGQTVSKGQKIGVMGQTGNSTGIHLHFEVYQNGQLKNPMDFLNR